MGQLVANVCAHPIHIFSAAGVPGNREFTCKCGKTKVTCNIKKSDGVLFEFTVNVDEVKAISASRLQN